MKFPFILGGNFKEYPDTKDRTNTFNLTTWFKKQLDYFNVAFSDPCCPVNNDLTSARYNNEDSTLQYYNPQAQTWIGVNSNTQNENLVNIISANNPNDFQKPHGTLLLGNSFYIGTRGSASTPKVTKFIYYPDYHDLTTVYSLSWPAPIDLFNNLESLVYEPTTNKIYAHFSRTNTILRVNPTNINDYTIVTVAGMGADVFETSAPIITDGLGNLYAWTYTATNSTKLLRINAATMTVTSSKVWTASDGAHAGVYDSDTGYGYFTSNLPKKFGKFNLAATPMTYTELPLVFENALTDDLILLQSSYTGRPTYVIGLCEGRLQTTSDQGGIIIDADNMTYQSMDLLPGTGLTHDYIDAQTVFCNADGFIETLSEERLFELTQNNVSTKFFTNVHTFRGGYYPNEIWKVPEGFLVTSFDSSSTVPKLVLITLSSVDKPIITKKEAEYRLT